MQVLNTFSLATLLCAILSSCHSEGRNWAVMDDYNHVSVSALVVSIPEDYVWQDWKIGPSLTLNHNLELSRRESLEANYSGSSDVSTNRPKLPLYNNSNRLPPNETLNLVQCFENSTQSFRAALLEMMIQEYQAREGSDYAESLKLIGNEAKSINLEFLKDIDCTTNITEQRFIVVIRRPLRDSPQNEHEWFLFIDGGAVVTIATLVPAWYYLPYRGEAPYNGAPLGYIQENNTVRDEYETGSLLKALSHYSTSDRVCYMAIGSPDIQVTDDVHDGLEFWHGNPIASEKGAE